MIPALKQYPRFEKGSPSTEYQQIMNFCVNYLEGLLVSLIHMDIPAEVKQHADIIKTLQQKLLTRERTVRHAFQFQVEKYFADFKSISRSRLRGNYASSYKISAVSDQTASGILDDITRISEKYLNTYKTQLQNTERRLKTLVHRSDGNKDDNPVSPLSLCNAFLASVETLNLSGQKNRYLLQLFDNCLSNQIGNFYNQIDLGFYYLDILSELTDPALFLPPEEDIQAEAETTGETELAVKDTLLSVTNELEQSQQDIQAVTSIQKHVEEKQQKDDKIRQIIEDFKLSTENGTMDYKNLFSSLSKKIIPLVEKSKSSDISKFENFFTSLLNNTLLSTPLKTQLSRLSSPLLELVLIDPFFFRSSSHPVNDFLQSIIDFELRFKHKSGSLAALSQLINSILELNQPALSDYQPLINQYEVFKTSEIKRLDQIKQEKTLAEEKLKEELLQIVNNMTEQLVVDHETMQFFYDDWQLVLLHLRQKEGADSAEFKQAIEQSKMLAWFLDENKTGAHPDFESISFKSVLTEIDKALVTLNFSSEHRNRTRKQLVQEYKKANNKQSFTIVPSTSKDYISDSLKLAHTHNNSANNISGLDATAITESLKKGDWVEIKSSSGKLFIRAKLKWIAVDQSNYIFIDQRGHNIKECNFSELNQAFSSGDMKLLKRPSHLRNVYS